VAIVERDFVAAWWILAQAGGYELHDSDGLRWFHTGAPEPYANGVLATHLADEEADAVIDATMAELRARGAPFTWWVLPGSRPADLAQRLTTRGLTLDSPWPGMIVRTDRVTASPVRDFEIRRVVDEEDFRRYLDIFGPILAPSEAFRAVFEAGARGIGFEADASEVHFLGLLHGEPVGTASLMTAGGAAGIYNVTTIERARGRGIGAALTAAAVHAGRERGLEFATLQASTMGRPVYERLGFEFVCDFLPYRDQR
jgi:ribosomal protein S18 acetylase RimI-like enzyme